MGWSYSEFYKKTGINKDILSRLRGQKGFELRDRPFIEKTIDSEKKAIITEGQLFEISIYMFIMNVSLKNKYMKMKERENINCSLMRYCVEKIDPIIKNGREEILNRLEEEVEKSKEILKQIRECYLTESNDTTKKLETLKKLQNLGIDNSYQVKNKNFKTIMKSINNIS